MSDNPQAEASTPLFQAIAQGLQAEGYVILPNALPESIAQALYAQALDSWHQFSPAGVGRQADRQHNAQVRRDKIAWIDAADPASEPWLSWTAQLQHHLNRQLFLGLFSFESHFARYAPGDFYKTHKDAFRGQSNRVLSLVAYLNRDWAPEQGGQLVIYNDAGAELARVNPEYRTLVVFLSEEFPHQVLPAAAERVSVAGWFRVNGSAAGVIDPPV